MALASLVSVEELSGWLREPLVEADARWAELILAATSSLIRSFVGQTWEGVAVPENARTVAFQVAARAYRNPEGASARSTTRGPFTDQVTFADAVGMTLTESEEELLSRLRSTAKGLWSLAVTRSEDTNANPMDWVPSADDPTSMFPWYVEGPGPW